MLNESVEFQLAALIVRAFAARKRSFQYNQIPTLPGRYMVSLKEACERACAENPQVTEPVYLLLNNAADKATGWASKTFRAWEDSIMAELEADEQTNGSTKMQNTVQETLFANVLSKTLALLIDKTAELRENSYVPGTPPTVPGRYGLALHDAAEAVCAESHPALTEPVFLLLLLSWNDSLDWANKTLSEQYDDPKV